MPRYIYPPRPKSRVLPTALSEIEKTNNYLVQRKFNGDRCVAVVESGKTSHLANRRGRWFSSSKHKVLRKELLRLNIPTGTTYLDGEILPSGVLVLFDVLQAGKYLLGKNQVDRLLLLDKICNDPKEFCEENVSGIPLAKKVSNHIWLADRFYEKFYDHFQGCVEHDLIEGLMLRLMDSTLDNWGSNDYQVGWQIRCRKPSKKYRY